MESVCVREREERGGRYSRIKHSSLTHSLTHSVNHGALYFRGDNFTGLCPIVTKLEVQRSKVKVTRANFLESVSAH